MAAETFITVPGFALELGLSGNDLLVYSLVYGYTAGDGLFMSLAKIAATLNLDRRTAQRVLSKLVSVGLLEKTSLEPLKPAVYKCKPTDELNIGKMPIGAKCLYRQNAYPIGAKCPPIINTKRNNNTIEKEIYKEKRFIKPTLQEVREYCAARGNNVDPQRFLDFYDAKGWKIGKNSIKDWRAAVRTWEARDRERNKSDTRRDVATAARNTIEAALKAMNKI